MTERSTGQPGAAGEAAAEKRTMLVVDLDGELLAPLRAAEGVLLCLGRREHDHRWSSRWRAVHTLTVQPWRSRVI